MDIWLIAIIILFIVSRIIIYILDVKNKNRLKRSEKIIQDFKDKYNIK
jgi:hypothetical protein